MKPSQDTTELYDSVTRSGQPAEFVGEDEVAGRNVYNFKVDASGPIQSLTVLAQFAEFPKQLPKSVVQGLLQAGTVPSDSTAVLEANLATMPNVLDIGFGSSNVVDVAVDTQFGAPLKVNQTQSMYVTVSVNGEDVPVLPLSTVKMHTADGEVAAAGEKLSTNGLMFTMIETALPFGLLFLGIGLLVLAALRWHKPEEAIEAGVTERTPTSSPQFGEVRRNRSIDGRLLAKGATANLRAGTRRIHLQGIDDREGWFIGPRELWAVAVSAAARGIGDQACCPSAHASGRALEQRY